MEYAGWSETPLMDSLALPEDWLETARANTFRIVGEIRRGRIDVLPADPARLRLLRCPRHLPRGVRRRVTSADSGGRMSAMPFTGDQTARHRRHPAPPRRLRGRRSRLRQDHRAGGILSPPGGSRRGPAAHPRHHLHREGRRQHAQEAGRAPSSSSPPRAPAWSAPGSPPCTASAPACCARTPSSPASIPSSACSTPPKPGACSRTPCAPPSTRSSPSTWTPCAA